MAPATLVIWTLSLLCACVGAIPGKHTALDSRCDIHEVDPCHCGSDANCTTVCRRVGSIVPRCTLSCTKGSNECSAWGEDLQCIVVDVRSDTGYCTGQSLLWILGVVFTMTGALISNFGLQLQKLAFLKHERKVTAGLVQRKQAICLPMWTIGLALMFSGSLMDFGALLFAAQSLLAPLGAGTMVINILLAPTIVGEKLSCVDVTCTFVIAFGCTLAVMYADHSTKTYTLEQMYEFWTRRIFVVWFAIEFVFLFGSHMILRRGRKPVMPGGETTRIEQSVQKGSNRYAFYFALIGGMCGGNSMLFAKILGEILKNISQGLSSVDMVVIGCLIVAISLSLYMQVGHLSEGLRIYDVLFMLPIYQAFWIFGSSVAGMLFFEEYVNFTSLQWVMFPVGSVITVGGVTALGLAYKQSSGQKNMDDKGTQLAEPQEVEDVDMISAPVPP